ncbi:MAG: type I 3-dehydroquinate dehydratase, partial [Planctomycetaceae bacterium]|nr:type I 3-dehydroquinate dehydratase [Planctomycetaceae bacterium]
MLAEEWDQAANAGADLVELRIDCLRREPDLRRILKNRPTPLVFTIRRGADGGLWSGTEEKRQQLLREAIALGVDYVDLELDIAGQIRRFGKTKRIVSYHNLKRTPLDVQDIAEQCEELDPDIVKIATAAASLDDASRVLRLGLRGKFPTITIAMGEAGLFTRILGARFGAPFTYAGFNPERVFAAGMPQFPVLRRDYCYEQIDSQTEVYAVIGDPIQQSLSPAIHNAAFRRLGLNKVLVPILVPSGELETFLRELSWLKIKGFSITIPHKEAIVPLLQWRVGAVEWTGSCNTVVIEADGRCVGYNTDYRAAIDSLEAGMGGISESDSNGPLIDKQVLILGAGGIARSLAFGLLDRGARVTITNRHDERAKALAEQIGCRMVTWSQRATSIADVVINCTPVGMHPHVDDTPLPPSAFSRPGIVVFDTVYHPENTMLLKLARE